MPHRLVATLALLACCAVLPGRALAYRYTISPPVQKGETPPVAAAPLRKEEAKAKQEMAELDTVRIIVEGHRDPDRRMPPPRSVEQKFTEALNEGNPEVSGGTIRHGMYYDGLVYWGRDPLSFLYNNIRGGILDAQ